MNKDKFIEDLNKKLKKLPVEEREAAITYYKEYFSEAGEENEQKVIEELGSTSNIASQIMANYIVKETSDSKKEKSIGNSISNLKLIFLAVLASPIALPLGITFITLVITTWIVIGTFIISGFAIMLASLTYITISIFTFPQDVFLGMFILGSGLLASGLGLIIALGSVKLFIKYSSFITSKISKYLLRKEKKDEEK